MSSPRNQAGPRVGDRALVKSDPPVFVAGVRRGRQFAAGRPAPRLSGPCPRQQSHTRRKAGATHRERRPSWARSAGNSVRGQLAARFLSRRLGLSLFASRPPNQAGRFRASQIIKPLIPNDWWLLARPRLTGAGGGVPVMARQQVLDTAEKRLFPAVTTEPAAEASAVSVPPFRFALAALRLELSLDSAFDMSVIWGEN